MVLPIVAYGHPVLRKLAQDIDANFPQLNKLIADMWETMYASNGVGLAAPQVNKDVRLFVVDSQQIFNNLEPDEKSKFPDEPGIKQVFINAHIEEINGEKWSYNEGCLSIPKIREDISRNQNVTLRFVDENFQPHGIGHGQDSFEILEAVIRALNVDLFHKLVCIGPTDDNSATTGIFYGKFW